MSSPAATGHQILPLALDRDGQRTEIRDGEATLAEPRIQVPVSLQTSHEEVPPTMMAFRVTATEAAEAKSARGHDGPRPETFVQRAAGVVTEKDVDPC